jgi:hypothetical protein
LLSEWRVSGLTAAEFCDRRGVVLSSFRWWRWRLSRERGESSRPLPPDLIPVRVIGALAADGAAETFEATLELIHPSGVRLRVPAGFDERTVAGVLWALEAVGSC